MQIFTVRGDAKIVEASSWLYVAGLKDLYTKELNSFLVGIAR